MHPVLLAPVTFHPLPMTISVIPAPVRSHPFRFSRRPWSPWILRFIRRLWRFRWLRPIHTPSEIQRWSSVAPEPPSGPGVGYSALLCACRLNKAVVTGPAPPNRVASPQCTHSMESLISTVWALVPLTFPYLCDFLPPRPTDGATRAARAKASLVVEGPLSAVRAIGSSHLLPPSRISAHNS